MLTTRPLAASLAAILLAALAGFAAEDRAGAGSTARLTVFAAASLTDVLPKIDRRPRYSFAGSSALAQQIRQGAAADVFASADLLNAQKLRTAGLCGKPVVFATNVLVVVVPSSNPGKVRTVGHLRRAGLKVVVAKPGVPIGDYTRTALRNLGIWRAVRRSNVVSEEPDVRGVLAKVALGEADAGIVYRTDAATVKGRVHVVGVPAKAQPTIRYGICVVTSSAGARAFVDRVRGKAGRRQLTAAGFGVPG